MSDILKSLALHRSFLVHNKWTEEQVEDFDRLVESINAKMRADEALIKSYSVQVEHMKDSHLTIAEIAAQRGVEPRDVAIGILESNGFNRMIDGNQSWLQNHIGDKTYVAGVDYEKVTMEGPNKNEFTLPYTAITPALIKAVCGGGE